VLGLGDLHRQTHILAGVILINALLLSAFNQSDA
jgi:hypothetical protein